MMLKSNLFDPSLLFRQGMVLKNLKKLKRGWDDFILFKIIRIDHNVHSKIRS